jgi:hypothetical protein
VQTHVVHAFCSASKFDTDEYLIPAGKWNDIYSWLKESIASGKIDENTHILSFFQTRAIPNFDFLEPYLDDKDCMKGRSDDEPTCLVRRPNVTFLQAYDCERTTLPKPGYGWRAKKQIYRPEFVLNHFVHYSTVTRRLKESPYEDSPLFIQRYPYERRVDELTEGFMLHTKTTNPSSTRGWNQSCRGTLVSERKKCPIGFSFLQNETGFVQNEKSPLTLEGYARNCYAHGRIQNDLVFKLEELLQKVNRQQWKADIDDHGDHIGAR